MAIFDPTQQINQLGQQAVQQAQAAGNQYVGQRQQQIDYTERMMDNISAIRDEAYIMHQDMMQDKIDATLSDLSDEIFTQRKNGQTEIDFRGFSGLNKKISKLKNLASNSQTAAQMYDQTLKMALQDKYVMNKPQVFQALTNIVSDEKLLEGDPKDLENVFSSAYMGSIDKVAKIGDLVKNTYGTEQFKRTEEDDQHRVWTIGGEYVRGVMDEFGNPTANAGDLIKQEAQKAGYNLNDEDVAQVFNRLSSARSATHDNGRAWADQEYKRRMTNLREQEARQGAGMTTEQAKDSLARFINGFTSGKLSEMQAASGSKKGITFIRASEVSADSSPRWQEALNKLKPEDVVGIKVDGQAYPATEDGLKQAYIASNNNNLGQKARTWMQEHTLSEDEIDLYENLGNVGVETGVNNLFTVPTWVNMTTDLVDAYRAQNPESQPAEEEIVEEPENSKTKIEW